jgi:23S rRNA (adenine2503-C2)-methyltransferase
MNTNIKDYALPELESIFQKMGHPAYRARQVAEWLLQKGATSFAEITSIPLGLRVSLSERFAPGVLQVLKKQVSGGGGAIKYLLGLADGRTVETVLMRYSYGLSVCLSTQVGCSMGCRLCASAAGGKLRDLSPGEMYDQVLSVQRDTGERVSRIVLMGTGEPLDNYDNTLKFIELVTAAYGLNISMRHITLSTCGVVPGIDKLAVRKLPLTLAVSLHAPEDGLRSSLMPINNRYPLFSLIKACRRYIEMTGRRITFEYALIEGVNDLPEHAVKLVELLRGMLCHVNLIPYNRVPGKPFMATGSDMVKAFKHHLEIAGIRVTVRRRLGTDIDAACGQLRRRNLSPSGD